MVKKIKSVTIGISALNEGKNIASLLESLKSQRTRRISIERIIVISDGSRDETSEKAKSIKSKKIAVIDKKERKGKSFRLNQIRKSCQTDILVVLDADIRILGRDFIEKLCKPIIIKDADLTSSRVLALKPVNWIENALSASVEMKDKLFTALSGGNNIYSCHGVARAFSRRLYENFAFEMTAGEDAYAYLYCISKGLRFEYARNAIAYIKLPSNINDYKKQRKRYLSSRTIMENKFGSSFVKKEYKIPLKNWLTTGAGEFVKHPIWLVIYAFLTFVTTVSSIEEAKIGYLWEASESSKILNN